MTREGLQTCQNVSGSPKMTVKSQTYLLQAQNRAQRSLKIKHSIYLYRYNVVDSKRIVFCVYLQPRCSWLAKTITVAVLPLNCPITYRDELLRRVVGIDTPKQHWNLCVRTRITSYATYATVNRWRRILHFSKLQLQTTNVNSTHTDSNCTFRHAIQSRLLLKSLNDFE